MIAHTPQAKAVVALFMLALIWGYGWIVMKMAMQHMGPIEFSAWRYFGGALVLFAVLLIQRQPFVLPPLLPTLMVGVAQTTLFPALSQSALIDGGAGKVALFSYTMPFWVVLLAWWWLHEAPGRRQWMGILLAITGLTCVIAPWQALADGTSLLLAIGSGIAWAVGTVLTKRTFQQHTISPLQFTAWQMLLGSVGLLALNGMLPSRPIDWNWALVAELAYSIFLASSLAWVLWASIVKTLPTSVAGLSSLLVPSFALLLGWLLLREPLNLTDLIGIGLIMLGLLVVHPRPHKLAGIPPSDGSRNGAAPRPDPGE